ncbi:APC family permease [Arcobacter sp.]|uniref:APC family permease n=1 Tax=Arcobacter sp. TaxID=1872629 RepID=UPI003D152B7F
MLEKKFNLKRDVSLTLLVFYGLGNIFGAGIYVLVGKIAGISGIYIPFSFLVACIVVLFTALSYAELSSRFPYSAGEALYAKKAFNSKTLSIAIGVLISLSGIISSATILHGFNGYVSHFINLPPYITSTLVITVLCIVCILGIGHSVKVASILTVIEIFGLLYIIFIGIDKLPFETIEFSKLIPPFEISVWHTIILGAFLAFYAFIGFEDMVNIAEEVKKPTKTMPKAIIIALFVSTIIYILVAIVSILAIEPNTLAKTNSPLADVYTKLTQKEPVLLSFIGTFAVLNGALIQIIMVSRVFYGMSMNKWIPNIFSKVNEKTRTPIFATVFASISVLIFTLWLPILTLANLTSFLIFVIFTLMNIALIKIKLQRKTPDNIISYPIYIPIIGIIINITMIAVQFISLL